MVPHAMAWVRHHDRYADGKKAAGSSGETGKTTPASIPCCGSFAKKLL
jgi:hypothetical protein